MIVYPIPPGVYAYGAIAGLLSALVALGMALIYRANRILNFAQGDLGLAPTVFAVDLIAYASFPYPVAFLVGLMSAVMLGVIIEFVIIRRFFRSPRLILTVATIGLAQLLTVGSLLIPMIWGKDPISQNIVAPFAFTFEIRPMTFHANELIAMVVAPALIVAVALFLRYTTVGIAVRASAERADRASLLGIPVKRLQTVVWVMATVLSFAAVFLRAGLTGLPFASNAGFGTTSFQALLVASLRSRSESSRIFPRSACQRWLSACSNRQRSGTPNDERILCIRFGIVILVGLMGVRGYGPPLLRGFDLVPRRRAPARIRGHCVVSVVVGAQFVGGRSSRGAGVRAGQSRTRRRRGRQPTRSGPSRESCAASPRSWHCGGEDSRSWHFSRTNFRASASWIRAISSKAVGGRRVCDRWHLDHHAHGLGGSGVARGRWLCRHGRRSRRGRLGRWLLRT